MLSAIVATVLEMHFLVVPPCTIQYASARAHAVEHDADRIGIQTKPAAEELRLPKAIAEIARRAASKLGLARHRVDEAQKNLETTRNAPIVHRNDQPTESMSFTSPKRKQMAISEAEERLGAATNDLEFTLLNLVPKVSYDELKVGMFGSIDWTTRPKGKPVVVRDSRGILGPISDSPVPIQLRVLQVLDGDNLLVTAATIDGESESTLWIAGLRTGQLVDDQRIELYQTIWVSTAQYQATSGAIRTVVKLSIVDDSQFWNAVEMEAGKLESQ